MITLAQTIIFVMWLIGITAGLITGIRQETENARLGHIIATLTTSGLLLICYVKTGTLAGFLWF